MHEAGVVGPRHVLSIYRPRHILREDLTVVGSLRDTGAAPVLSIDEVGTFESLALVVLHACIADEFRVEFVTLGMGDDQVHVGGIHPLSKRIGHSLRQCLGVRRPGENDLGALALMPMFFDRDEVGKSLQGMYGSRLHSKDRATTVLDKLLHDGLGIVVVAVTETSKRTDAYDVAVAPHHGNGFQQVLALVAVHDDTTLCLQLPCTLIHVEHNDVHAQVHGCLLGGESRTQRVIEEYHQEGLVLTQVLILETVSFDFLCLGQCFL